MQLEFNEVSLCVLIMILCHNISEMCKTTLIVSYQSCSNKVLPCICNVQWDVTLSTRRSDHGSTRRLYDQWWAEQTVPSLPRKNGGKCSSYGTLCILALTLMAHGSARRLYDHQRTEQTVPTLSRKNGGKILTSIYHKQVLQCGLDAHIH